MRKTIFAIILISFFLSVVSYAAEVPDAGKTTHTNSEYGYSYTVEHPTNTNHTVSTYFKSGDAPLTVEATTALLSELGMSEKHLNAVSSGGIERYSTAKSITNIVENKTTEDGGELRISLVSAQLNNGYCHYAVDVEWLVMPTNRNEDSILLLLNMNLPQLDSCNGWYSYTDGWKDAEGEREILAASEFRSINDNNLVGISADIPMPTDSDHCIAHVECTTLFQTPSMTSNYNAYVSYTHYSGNKSFLSFFSCAESCVAFSQKEKLELEAILNYKHD